METTRQMKRSALIALAVNIVPVIYYFSPFDWDWAWRFLGLIVKPGDLVSSFFGFANVHLGIIGIGAMFIFNFIIYWILFYIVLLYYQHWKSERGHP